MRKWLALLLALLLPSSAAAAETRYEANGIFAFSYPDGFELDDKSYLGDNEEDYVWLCDLYADEITVLVSMERVDGYAGVSLRGATDAEMDAYRADLLSVFAEDGAKLLRDGAGRDQTPFVALMLEDKDGVYARAQTLLNGWELSFSLWSEGRDFETDDLSVLYDLIASFEQIGVADASNLYEPMRAGRAPEYQHTTGRT